MKIGASKKSVQWIISGRPLRLATIGLALLVVCTLIVVWPREPAFHGKPLSRWLAEFNRVPPDQPTPEAEEAIRTIGPSALPFLLSYIWADEPSKVWAARNWINKTLHKSYRSPIDLCAPSWRALSILGPAATPAIPEIMRHAAQGPFKGRAMIALAVLGTNGIPSLIALCGHSNTEVRIDAAFLLVKSSNHMPGLESFIAISPFSGQPMLAYNIKRGVEDLEALLKNLHSNQTAVRRATVEAIGSRIDLRNSAQLEIKACMGDPDAGVREAAAKVLN